VEESILETQKSMPMKTRYKHTISQPLPLIASESHCSPNKRNRGVSVLCFIVSLSSSITQYERGTEVSGVKDLLVSCWSIC